MVFWIVITGLAVAVASYLAMSLRAPRAQAYESPAAYDLRVYRDQLREVEKDLARGVVTEEDAARVRAEVSRRILAADAAMSDTAHVREASRGAPRVLAAIMAGGVIAASLLMYLTLGAPGYGDLGLDRRIDLAEEARQTRPDQATAEAGLPPYQPPQGVSPDYVALMEQLRATVADRPDDVQGHLLLARNEANLGNFRAAARAQEAVVRLKGPSAGAADFADLADLLVLAAGGYVSPEAEAAVNAALSKDAANGTARYYLALMHAQTGRPDRAFRLWTRCSAQGRPMLPGSHRSGHRSAKSRCGPA